MNKKFYALMFLLLVPFAGSCAEYTEGKEYQRITEQPTDSGDKVEILEFFWYGCPHCYQFEPHIQKWKKSMPANVEFKRIPVVFRPNWKVHGRMYYALEIMGKVEELHPKIFKAMHKDKIKLNTESQVKDFLVSQGIDAKAYDEAYNSFSIDTMLRKAIKKTSDYKITGVPAVGINGRYTSGGQMAGTYENLISVINHLIEKESSAKSSK